MSKSQTCEACKHCRAVEILEKFGGGVQHECHFNPPVTLQLAQTGVPWPTAPTMGFPWVRPDDWCKEHTLKVAA